MTKDQLYRQILMYAFLLGLIGGLGAVVFTLVTQTGSVALFGEDIAQKEQGSWYWIPLTAIGALLVTYFRQKFNIPEKVSSAVELAEVAKVDLKTALPLLGVAVLSIVFGASLGPSFGIILFGGAFAGWLIRKVFPRYVTQTEKDMTRIGMAGSLGAVFGAPILSAILSVEVSKAIKNYTRFVLPILISASIGYVVFFGIMGATIINAYTLPDYTYRNVDLLFGVVLGGVSLLALMIFKLLSTITSKMTQYIANPYMRALIGGACIGLLSVLVPLSFGSGNSQLLEVTSRYTEFAALSLVTIIIVKAVAIKLSEESGFVGGTVFPILFYSGTVGVLVHVLFPSIPIALSVGALMASVPGAVLAAPISLILIAVGSTGQSSAIIPPLTIAVVVTQIGMYVLKNRRAAT